VDDAGRRYARRILARFGRLAAIALVGLAVSGLLLMGHLVATPDALIGSAYGTSLMLKTAVVAGVALLGMLNAAAMHRSFGLLLARVVPPGVGDWFVHRDIRRSVRAEAVGGLVVIGLAVLLASTPPARGPAWDPLPADAVTAPVAGAAADLLVTVDIRPNQPGRNVVSLRIVDTRRPAPAPIAAVTLRMLAPDGGVSDPVLASVGGGQFEATPTLLGAGRWGTTVTIVRTGLPDASFETPWTVLPPGMAGGQRQVQVSDAPLAPILTPLAAALVVGAVTIGLMLIVGRILGRSGRGRSGAAPLNLRTRSIDG
jgi:copper transport protein